MALSRETEVAHMKLVEQSVSEFKNVVQRMKEGRQGTKAKQLEIAIARCQNFLEQFEAYK